jgi:hypothetical protein
MSLRKNIAAVLAGASALAAAGVAVADTLPVPAAQRFYFSGSTAMDNTIKALFLHTGGTTPICAAGADVYTDNSLQSPVENTYKGGHNNTVVCKLNSAIGSLTAGTVVALTKESNGGSLEGSFPIARNLTMKFIDAGTNPTCAGSTTVAGNLSYNFTQGYTLHYGCAVTGNIVPSIGVADENLAAFNIGINPLTATDRSKLNYNTLAQMPFGVVVSLNLYRALQRSQGLALDDTLAHMPTLSTQQIRTIYQGGAASWAAITDASGKAINDIAYTNGVTVSSQVYLCRRGDSSGTNAAFDIRFTGNRCVSDAVSPMAGATTTTANCSGLPAGETPTDRGCAWTTATNLADTVFAGFSGGDVTNCVHAHDKANQFAIGHVSTTSKFDDAGGLGGSADATGSNHWRYIRIDGASPDSASMVNGSYDWAYDNILIAPKTATAEVNAVITTLLTDFTQHPELLTALLVQQPGGDPNYVTGPLMDQFNPLGAPVPNTTPPYATGAGLAAGTVNPVSGFTYLANNSTEPQDCAPSVWIPNPGLITKPQ